MGGPHRPRARSLEILPQHRMVRLAQFGHGAGGDDLAAKTQNPVGAMYSLPFKFNFDYGADNGEATFLNIQPVIPFDLPWESVPKIITRITIPAYVSTPDLPVSGSVDGFGDTVFLGFLMPKLEGFLQLGTMIFVITFGFTLPCLVITLPCFVAIIICNFFNWQVEFECTWTNLSHGRWFLVVHLM